MPVLRSICVDMGTFGAPRGIASQAADLVAVANLSQMAAFTDNSRFYTTSRPLRRGMRFRSIKLAVSPWVCGLMGTLRGPPYARELIFAAAGGFRRRCGPESMKDCRFTADLRSYPQIVSAAAPPGEAFSAADPLRCRCRPEQMPVLPRNPRSFDKRVAAELALRRPSNWQFHRQIGGIHRIVSRRR
jgi:hypothetical protein